jgi:hypothetical protein
LASAEAEWALASAALDSAVALGSASAPAVAPAAALVDVEWAPESGAASAQESVPAAVAWVLELVPGLVPAPAQASGSARAAAPDSVRASAAEQARRLD